jgi:hypothetical protein
MLAEDAAWIIVKIPYYANINSKEGDFSQFGQFNSTRALEA